MAANSDDDLSGLYDQLRVVLLASGNGQDFYKAVVESPFEHTREMAFLFLGFICCFVVDDDAASVKLAAVTDNDYYRQSVEGYRFEERDYIVPLSATGHDLVRAIQTGKAVVSTDWDNLRRPKVAKGVARINQASSGIGCSIIQPFEGKVSGALMFNFYQYQEALGEPAHEFMRSYTGLVSSLLDSLRQPVAS